MARNDFIHNDDLVNNPATRVAICLCLDSSGSMDGAKLNELNHGIKEFYTAVRNDRIALSSAELCIVTFGEDVRAINDFTTLDNQEDCQISRAWGGTPMGEGVKLALQKLEERKQKYKAAGVEYYQPWLVIMGDGEPNYDSPVDEAASETCELEAKKKLSVFSIGIGDDADMDVLSKFSKKRTALKLQGLKFSEFFEWLSASVAAISRSQPDETVKLDLEGLKGWAEL